jgi:RNA polymerase sigma factor (sigma-70 family)
MVLGVCRRILRNEQDAEDAFQATFLVLVRKAASLRSPHTLANWLHGVARRTALEARSSAARRRAKEAAVPPRMAVPDDPWDDLRPVLDQELGRLAEKYRIAVVLCDLEGKTRKEVARQLGWAEGTVASRLARGRGILARRLARRGFAGALVAAALADGAAPAGVPSALVVSTVTAASFSAARAAAAHGVLSGTAAALTEGVLKSMLLTKLKNALVVSLVIGIATLSAGALISRGGATEPADGQAQGRANRDDLPGRVAELKQQLQQLQKEIARLEQETTPRHEERNTRDAFLADRLKFRVPFETGFTETSEGGRLEIQEVWGTRPRIEVGGQYLVRGKYALPPGERGRLYFYETAEGAWGLTPTADMDLQSTTLDKEKGEFTLLHGMAGPGYFHLYLASPERYSRYFANVYFGTGDNVWRKKP